MKSAVETLNPTRVKLTVEVTLDELRPSLDKAYRTIGGQIQVPGFRKGKVPPRIIDQRVGRGTVLQEAINDALPGFYQQAVTETEVRPMGQPEVEVTAVPAAAGSSLEFTAEVDVRPQVELPEYSSIAVTVDDVEVTDEAVDAQLQQLRQRFGTLTPVQRPVEAGDVLSLDLTARIDGEEIETVTGHTYEVGSGQLLEGADEAVTGASQGDVVTFPTVLAGGEHQGEEAEVTLTVVSVKVRELPEVDDDFAQMASEFDTVDDMVADLRTRAEDQALFGQGVQARDKVLEALLEAVEVPVPEALVEAEVHQHLENESRLEDDEHRAEVTVEARKALRAQILLDAVAEREQVRVEQSELIEYIVAQAPRYGMDPSAFAKAMEQSGQLPAVVSEVARRKALSVVLEQATITDASGRPVSLGDDEDEADGVVVDDAVGAVDATAEDAAVGADDVSAVDGGAGAEVSDAEVTDAVLTGDAPPTESAADEGLRADLGEPDTAAAAGPDDAGPTGEAATTTTKASTGKGAATGKRATGKGAATTTPTPATDPAPAEAE